jgi:hypothetical protein
MLCEIESRLKSGGQFSAAGHDPVLAFPLAAVEPFVRQLRISSIGCWPVLSARPIVKVV